MASASAYNKACRDLPPSALIWRIVVDVEGHDLHLRTDWLGRFSAGRGASCSRLANAQ